MQTGGPQMYPHPKLWDQRQQTRTSWQKDIRGRLSGESHQEKRPVSNQLGTSSGRNVRFLTNHGATKPVLNTYPALSISFFALQLQTRIRQSRKTLPWKTATETSTKLWGIRDNRRNTFQNGKNYCFHDPKGYHDKGHLGSTWWAAEQTDWRMRRKEAMAAGAMWPPGTHLTPDLRLNHSDTDFYTTETNSSKSKWPPCQERPKLRIPSPNHPLTEGILLPSTFLHTAFCLK